MNGTPSHRRRLLGAWAFAAMLAILVACGVPTPPTVEAPEITAFSATPTEITAGDDATLAWTVAGTATVTLSDGTDPVAIPSGASQVVVSPDATTTYTLTATNAGGTDTAQVTVIVTKPVPEITSFTATPSSILEGGSSTLAWSVVGATTIALSDGTDPVAFDPSGTSVVVSPTVTTTYTLTATNAFGDATLDATVTVVPAGTTSLSDLTATVVAGSQVELELDRPQRHRRRRPDRRQRRPERRAAGRLARRHRRPRTPSTIPAAPARCCASAPAPPTRRTTSAWTRRPRTWSSNARDYDPYDTAYWRSRRRSCPSRRCRARCAR